MTKKHMLIFIIFILLISSSLMINTYSGNNSGLYVKSIETEIYCIDSEDNVWQWNYNTPEKLEGFTNVADLSANNGTIMVLKKDGTVWTRGDNTYGQLGNGKYLNSDKLVQVEGLCDIKKIADGSDHMVALKKDGTVWTWGNNFFFQLGSNLDNSNKPIQIHSISDVVDIQAGDGVTIFLKSDGTVWMMGKGVAVPAGELRKVGKLFSSPTKLAISSKIKQISLTNEHLLALDENGLVWAWGENSDGQLGYADRLGSSEPFAIKGLTNIKDILAGYSFSAVLKDNGSVYVWGRNIFEENKSNEIIPSPITFALMNEINDIEGWCGLVAQKKNGVVAAWTHHTKGILNSIDSQDVKLVNINVNKTSLYNFTNNKTIYDVVLPANAKKAPLIEVATSNPQASVDIQYPDKLPGSVRITVNSKDGKNRKNYYVNLTKQGDKTNSIYVDGIILNTLGTISVNNTLLVPIYDIYYLLGIDFTKDTNKINIVSRYNDINITLKKADTNAIVNGKVVKLTVAPIERNGMLYVPLRFLVENTGNELKWNNKTNSIHISTIQAERDLFYSTSDIKLALDKEIINVGEQAKAKIEYGMNVKLNKEKVEYSSSRDEVVTIDKEGNIIAKKEGSAYINASYIGKYKSVLVNVVASDTVVINSEDELRTFMLKGASSYKTEAHLLLSRHFSIDKQTVDKISREIANGIDGYYFRFAFCPRSSNINVSNGEYIYTDLKFIYKLDKAQKEAMDLKTDEIISKSIHPSMSDFEKVKAIHDYIVLNTAYDYENYLNDTIPEVSGTAYGVLVKGTGVCGGYADTMKYLLQKLNIECYYVIGTVDSIKKRDDNHAWNIVKIDNKYYHIDSTWDDPAPNIEGHVRHKYFLLTDEQISKDHKWNKRDYPPCN